MFQSVRIFIKTRIYISIQRVSIQMDNRYTTNFSSNAGTRPQTYNSYESSTSGFKNINQQQQRPSSSIYTSGNQSNYSNSYNTGQNFTNNAESSYNDSFSKFNKNGGLKTENFKGTNEIRSGAKGQTYIETNLGKQDNKSYNSGSSTQNAENKGKEQLSWTKYLSMEFKVEQLQKVKLDQEKQIRQKVIKIAELDKNLIVMKFNWDRAVKDQQRKYEKQLADQKMNYEQIIQTKNKQIDTLLAKVGDQTKASLSQQIQKYLQQIFNQNTEITIQLTSQKAEKQALIKKIQEFEQQESNQQLIEKQKQIIQNLSSQLDQVSGRLATRVTPTNDNNSFFQVLSSQAAQIRQLSSSLELIQNEYLKCREKANESENKLRNFENEQIQSTRKQKIQINNTISNLQFKVTQKEHECFSISRRLKSAEQKIKNLLEQTKAKSQTLRLTYQKFQKPEEESKLPQFISQFLQKTKECSLCQQRMREIQTLEQKITLLKN